MSIPQAPASIRPSRRHRRQTFWQIIFPVVLAALGAVALIVLLSIGAARGSAPTGQWASISTIWLVIPLIFMGLLFSAFIAGMIFLLARLTHKLPTYTRLIHLYLQIASVKLTTAMDAVSRPQISLLSRWAGFTSVFKRSSRKSPRS